MLANPAFTSSLQAELVATLPDADRVIPQIASIKRFVERWLADDQLRQKFQSEPAVTARHYSVPVGLREFLLEQKPLSQSDDPALRGYEVYLRQRADHRARMRQECTPTSEPFKAWRERQIKRCQRQLPQHYNDAIMHLPVAFELCQGCSVGCWFCGLSAARLESVFEANEANRALWRETLEVMRDVAGPAAGRGIAFWATDPLDNPDYEQLCQDFRNILGRFPATTTALGPKDLERTRRLLEQWPA